MTPKEFSSASALFAAAAIAGSASATTVWNVNIGEQIDESDNYVGAATENTANSTWNSFVPSNFSGLTLADSTGDSSAGVTLTLTSNSGSNNGFSNTGLTTGDEIFIGWTKSSNNATPFTITFDNLNPSAEYDMVVYSDWFWDNGSSGMPVTQTVGTGLAGTYFVNRDANNDAKGLVGPLLEDVDPANVDVGKTNYARITGLSTDGAGTLAFDMGGVNGSLSGMQLVETVVPEPASGAMILMGLGVFAARRRR